MSSAVAGSRSTPRWPMTKTRNGACGTWVAKSMSQRRSANASRYSGKLCQFHGTPSRMTSSGMSSTPSMTLISVSRSCGRQGAKPTPQLPISDGGDAVPRGGREAVVPGHLAVIVRVDVDEARRDQQPPGVDLLAPGAGDAADRGDAARLHGDVGLARLAARAVEHGAAAHHQVELGCHGSLL